MEAEMIAIYLLACFLAATLAGTLAAVAFDAWAARRVWRIVLIERRLRNSRRV
jgi:hypothetical protein